MAKKKKNTTDINEYETSHIHVLGARVHNLKDIDISIPRNQLVVITGISGSGKSSLAFDTIYAEGQRRYMESFSAYARQFIGGIERPDVDKITGLSPVISIEQKTTNKNPRSTVGTVTEIYDFMRLLWARTAEAYSYVTGKKMVQFTEQQILDQVLKDQNGKKVIILAPVVRGRKGHYRELFQQLQKKGFLRVRVDGEVVEIKPKMQLDRYAVHDIEAVIDRVVVNEDDSLRISKSIETAMEMGNNLMMLLDFETNELQHFSKNLMCPESGISYEVPSPNSFSFNSPYGSCQKCRGLGFELKIDRSLVIPDESKSINEVGIVPLGEVRDTMTFKKLRKLSRKHKFTFSTPVTKIPEKAMNVLLYGDENGDPGISSDYGINEKYDWYDENFEGLVPMLYRSFNGNHSDAIRRWAEAFMSKELCSKCEGARIRKESRWFKIADKSIDEINRLDIEESVKWFSGIEKKLTKKQKAIGAEVLKEIKLRLGFLENVGLDYLNLNRPTRTLSGGESQRIRLATQIGSKLSGITYILDEPSIGLHQRDNQKLIVALKELRDAGNSVLVVEHDKEIMEESDYVIDIGPGAGVHGGMIVAEGKPKAFFKSKTLTASYLNGKKEIEIPKERRKGTGEYIEVKGATGNNLKNVDLKIPLGTLTVVTGVSGSGKSTLVNETLYPILNQHFFRARKKPLAYKSIEGIEHLDKVIEIDQSPIGRTPRSNPATYIGVFTDIRQMFTRVPEAQIRGYKAGRFSFNVKTGRCDVCEGAGIKTIEMNFLPDVQVPCEKCLGKRFNRETLEIRYKNKSIYDILDMTVEDAEQFFEHVPKIHRRIKTLMDVGLGYIKLGQSSTTISGGEAQRVKLSSELSKKDTGKTIYILDEPTTGLHFEDIRLLLNVLQQLVEKGNTVVIIEHNLDVVKVADHIIDVGPEGGKKGGKILVSGTPEQVAKKKGSFTGFYLEKELV